jgi:hypothetical protein
MTQNPLPEIFRNAPDTSTSLDAATDQWIVIQPRLNQCWLIAADQWRCMRFDITKEEINAIQAEQ